MEWVSIVIVLLVLGVLSFFYPAARVLLIGNVFRLLRENEAWIVQASYNSLPRVIKDKVDSQVFAAIVANVLNFGIGAVEKDIKK